MHNLGQFYGPSDPFFADNRNLADDGPANLLSEQDYAPMMIQASGLTHFYGPHLAIQDVSFGVEKGEILGFLGPNGAGKTTTMRILTGYMPPTRGKVLLDGFDVVEQSLQARRKIGYLPETVPLYTDMTVSGYLKYMGTLRGMPPRNIKRRVSEVVDICRLGDYHKTIIGKLSKGFRQRVGVAQAIIHEPEVLVLDEPTIGIDPIQVVETRRLIQDLGKAQTVVLSSHILPEVSMICQRVMIIHEGNIVAGGHPGQPGPAAAGCESPGGRGERAQGGRADRSGQNSRGQRRCLPVKPGAEHLPYPGAGGRRPAR